MALRSSILFVAKYAGGGILSYVTPRFLVAAGVPLDRWVIIVGGWASLHVHREMALWAVTFFVGAILYGGSIVFSRDHDWRPSIPPPIKRLLAKVEPSHVIILGLAIALSGVVWQMRYPTRPAEIQITKKIGPGPSAPLPGPDTPLSKLVESFLAKRQKTPRWNSTAAGPPNVGLATDGATNDELIYLWDEASLGAWPTTSDGFTELQLRKEPSRSKSASKNHPEYIRGIAFSFDDDRPLILTGKAAQSLKDVKIVVYAMAPHVLTSSLTDFLPTTVAQLDIEKDEPITVQLVFKGPQHPSYKTDLYWGDPKKNNPVVAVNRVRLVIRHGNKEQDFLFEALRMTYDGSWGMPNQQIRWIMKNDLDWANRWEALDK